MLPLTRLSDAVFVLLQMTVDTFVGKYTERIESQTGRLEGFNRMVTHELRQPLHNAQLALDLLTQNRTSGCRDRRAVPWISAAATSAGSPISFGCSARSHGPTTTTRKRS